MRPLIKRLTGPALLAGAAASALLIATPIVTASLTPAAAQARIHISAEFRAALDPYGEFRPVRRWGECWVPANVGPDWRPYTVGHWVYTDDYGWYWVAESEEAAWGWVTYHYGRWVRDRDVGWCWTPGREWGPAWVDWRRGRNHVGWAPLPPDEVIVEIRDDPEFWIFVHPRDLIAPRIHTVILPLQQHPVFLRETVVVNRTVIVRERNLAVNPGIAPAFIAAAVGRPLRTFDVQPRVFAGTANIRGAIQVRAEDIQQNRQTVAREAVVQQSTNVVQPAKNIPAPQALGRNEHGRLGDTPPRAARGEERGTAGAAPSGTAAPSGAAPEQRRQGATPPQPPAPPAAQGREQRGTSGAAPSGPATPEQRRQGATPPQQPAPPAAQGREQRGPAEQRREGAAPREQAPPAAQRREERGRMDKGRETTGQSPPAQREERRGVEQKQQKQEQRGPAVQQEQRRIAPQAERPRERAIPPAGRPQTQPGPAARQAPAQAPAARQGPPAQAPAAQAPRREAPAAQAPRPQPPAAAAPRPQQSTTGAGPNRGGPPEKKPSPGGPPEKK